MAASLWTRFVTAARMAVLAFNERALIPTENYDWDQYQSRIFRYALAEAYYNNIAYRSISTFAQRLKSNSDLYKFTRGIYNPVYRLTEAYTAKVYGGSLDYEDLSRGAIPITQASDELKLAIRQVWLWSNWQTQKSLYVRQGSQLGDVGLKVVDEPDKGRVRLEVLHPGRIKEADFDSVKNLKSVTIEYERMEDDGKTWYLYTEKIDQERFQFFKANKPYDYVNNVPAGELSEYPNIYGFVPLVVVNHKDMGQTWGANAFHGQLGKIDELNDAASLLNDQIRKSVNLIWYFAGVKKKDDLTASTDDKDQVPAIYGPADSQPYPMIGNVDLGNAGANIERLLAELERDMPELAMHRLRDAGNPTAPGIKAGYNDAIDRFTEAQGIYDDGLIRAQKMAVTIGGIRKYENFTAFNESSFDKGDLDHFIQARPIVVDELTQKEKIDTLTSNQAPIWLVLRELGYDEDTIDEVQADKEKQMREAVRAFSDSTFGQDGNTDGSTTDAQTTDGQPAQDQTNTRSESAAVAASGSAGQTQQATN